MADREVYYLIIRADRTARVVTRYPSRLRLDEIAIRLNVTFPPSWGRVAANVLEVSVPDLATGIEIGEPVQPEPAEDPEDVPV